jgi:hypothetical protein
MVARPDSGVPDRTVCQLMEENLVTMSGGEFTNLKAITLDEVAKFTKIVWAAGSEAPTGA